MNYLLIPLFILALSLPVFLWAQPIELELRLAQVAQPERLFQMENSYWLSEKYDGVRAYWDGRQLWTRQGNKIHAPLWFTKDFPKQALDGELWISRGQFERTSGIVRTRKPKDADWQRLKFMVFDLPDSKLPFESRQKQLHQTIRLTAIDWLRIVEQKRVNSLSQLDFEFQTIVDAGGEGVMLNAPGELYKSGRDEHLVKLKPFHDDEAIVLEHIEGKGKYLGMLGAILVKNRAGKTFRIGSGFKDAQRQAPPAIGTIISYRYSGFTNSGKPRFAVYLRQRTDMTTL